MLDELRRRNVHRTALAYLAASWLLVQIVETLTPDFLPPSVFRATVILLAIGFVPALVLAWKFEWTPDGFKREENVRADAVRPRSVRFDRAITVMLVLAVTCFAVDKFVFEPERNEAKVRAATEEATKRALSGAFLDEFRGRSVLVLPFLNLSNDAEQAVFADGISEEILNILARIEELRVISRSTSWTFKGQDVDIDEVHRDLDVSHVLEGSVRKSGNQIRVTAQLIDARTDTHLWSKDYDRRLDDVFAIQDEIAVAVADELHLKILSSDSYHKGIDPEAYELFLRAGVDPSTLNFNDENRLADAKRLLEQALRIEPDYLPAMNDLAAVHEFLSWKAAPEDLETWRQSVVELVDKMEALAPDSVFVSNWRAYMAMRWDGDLVGAALYLEKTLRYANRTDARVWFNGAIDLLMLLGRNAEAMTVAQYWANRDPYCTLCLRKLARAAEAAGRRMDAALVLSQLTSRTSDSYGCWQTGVAYLAAGMPDEALQWFDRIAPDTEIDRDFARAFALYSLGHVREFEAYIDKLESTYPVASAEAIARLYAWSGQRDKAFHWLEKMVEDEGPELVFSIDTELYDPIKSDPRWKALRLKYGIDDRRPANVRFEPEYPPVLQRAVDSLKTT